MDTLPGGGGWSFPSGKKYVMVIAGKRSILTKKLILEGRHLGRVTNGKRLLLFVL